ncbi:hypothetical protein, conserved [Eimeria necatrix]|uniref:Uncharacterized protein n=1 Tax=Eimeria necatrix TaxID=51315 RepID=U6MFB6_9EIME|nr:hypothetical protein, conserved [Eimeria necatrix]CDJ62716.1 hypothetical protein, conserved [Eimeria necatrix]
MNQLSLEEFRHDLSSSASTHSHSRRNAVQSSADGSFFVQRAPKSKLFPLSLAPRLCAVFSSLAVAYVLLLCFRSIGAGRQQASPARSLAAGGYGPCRSDFLHDDEEDDDGETGGWAQRLVQSLLQEQRMSPPQQAFQSQGNVGLPRDEGYFAGQAVQGTSGDVAGGGSSPDSSKTHDLHLWVNRNMPTCEREFLLRTFGRIVQATRLCGSLLTVMTCRQRLYFTFHVVRLLALDLGALTLVKEDIEPTRSAVGDCLIQLAKQSLERGGDDEGNEGDRIALRELIVLIREIKKPRLIDQEKTPTKYKKKMISILATSDTVLRNCLGVLRGLHRLQQSLSLRKLPASVLVQQLGVLKALYHVHADYLARDGSLRAHILECQKRTRLYVFFGREHFKLSKGKILPVKELQSQISAAVRAAGGLLQRGQGSAWKRESDGSAMEEQTEEGSGEFESLSRLAGNELLQGALSQAIQASYEDRTSEANIDTDPDDTLQGEASPPWSDWLLEQGASAGPALMPPTTDRFAGRPVEQPPQFVSPQTFLSAVGMSVFWSPAARGGALHGSPYYPGAYASSARPFQMSAASYGAPFFQGSSSAQHVSAGQTATAHLMQAPLMQRTDVAATAHLMHSPLVQRMDVAEPSAWLETRARSQEERQSRLQLQRSAELQEDYMWLEGPASMQETDYSLFGDGGIPPWSPFPQAPAESIESPVTASSDFPGSLGGASFRFRRTEGQDEAGVGRLGGRIRSGRQ